MWERLYQRLVADQGREVVLPPETTIAAALKQAEAELGVRFPASYKAFIHQFGPGELAGFFRIYAPAVPGCRDYGNHIVKDNREWRHPRSAWATSGRPELVARLVVFSTTIGGDAFFWDPENVREVRKHEYGIYLLDHGSTDMKVQEAASSFREFVEEVCLDDRFPALVGAEGCGEDRPEALFAPVWRTRKAVKR
jgi:hypothetical protein